MNRSQTTDLATADGRYAFLGSLLEQIPIGALFARWLDEREFEDFGDYAKALTKEILFHAPVGTVVIKCSKSPFGILFSVPGLPYDVRFFATQRSVGWRSHAKPKVP